MLQPSPEFNPKKKSRVPRIIAQILSTLFTAVMMIGLVSCFTIDPPRYIPSEEVNLYNTNYDDVYELTDLNVISKYSSDEDFDYYLVLLPYKDEVIKAASLRCPKHYYDIYSDDDENSVIDNLVMNVGVTINTMDILYDNIGTAYNNAFEVLKSSGMEAVSTELSFDFACEPNQNAFSAYLDEEKTANVITMVCLGIFSVLGIILMIVSFKNSNYSQEQVYFVPGSSKTSLDYDFDKRF